MNIKEDHRFLGPHKDEDLVIFLDFFDHKRTTINVDISKFLKSKKDDWKSGCFWKYQGIYKDDNGSELSRVLGFFKDILNENF